MLIILGVNEAQDVRMSYAHHSHVGAPPHAALFHGIGRRIENIHERDGAAGDAVSSADHRATGSQFLKGEAGAAARLMNNRSVGRRLHDAGDRVRHIEHKTSGQLSVRFAGIDQARRVGYEFTRQHDVGHDVEEFIALIGIGFSHRDVRHDTGDDV